MRHSDIVWVHVDALMNCLMKLVKQWECSRTKKPCLALGDSENVGPLPVTLDHHPGVIAVPGSWSKYRYGVGLK